MNKRIIGSLTAKGGFANEHNVVAKFNNWENDTEAQDWLKIMGYNLEKVDKVTAIQIPAKLKKIDAKKYGLDEKEFEQFIKFKKADIQIQILIQIGGILRIENLSLKKANSDADFNQIDKRTVDSYQALWGFDDEVAFWLKLFTGELLIQDYPNLLKNQFLREKNRIFIDEMPVNIQCKIIDFFDRNRIIVLSDVLRGRGGLAADWLLVTRKNPDKTISWILENINSVLNFYGNGEVKISPRGSLIIGKIFMQRKGGTPDPTKLQFKFKPCELFRTHDDRT